MRLFPYLFQDYIQHPGTDDERNKYPSIPSASALTEDLSDEEHAESLVYQKMNGRAVSTPKQTGNGGTPRHTARHTPTHSASANSTPKRKVMARYDKSGAFTFVVNESKKEERKPLFSASSDEDIA